MQPVIIVTGGSRGIGAATVRLAAKQGYAVCINYRENEEAANNLLAELKTMGSKTIAVKADVSEESQVLSLFQKVDQELGPVTALVNNAGITETQMCLEMMDAARIERVFKANVISSFLCAREAIKRMSNQKGGKGGAIVNLSSRAACLGSPNEYIDYAASKGAIDTFTKGLSLEIAKQGIRVNAVRPGLIYTEFHVNGGDQNRVKRLESGVPMQRGGQSEEVAQAILWLLSEEASYVTGSFIDVSGGR